MIEKICGTCGCASPGRPGASYCKHQPAYIQNSNWIACTFDPPRWVEQDDLQREVRLLLAIDTLEGRRKSLAVLAEIRPPAFVAKVKFALTEVWRSRKVA